MADDRDLVTVARFSNSAEAELARERLGLEGLEAFVVGTATASVVPHVTSEGALELQVAPENAQQAREILGVASPG